MSSKIGRLSDEGEAEYKRIVGWIGHGSSLSRNEDLRRAKRAIRRLFRRIESATKSAE